MLELLIKRGLLDGQFRYENGMNYLQAAIAIVISNPHIDIDIVEVAKVLINHEAWSLSNDRDNQERSSMHFAVQLQNYELLSILIKRGVNINEKSFSGVSPLHTAVNKNYENVVDFFY